MNEIKILWKSNGSVEYVGSNDVVQNNNLVNTIRVYSYREYKKGDTVTVSFRLPNGKIVQAIVTTSINQDTGFAVYSIDITQALSGISANMIGSNITGALHLTNGTLVENTAGFNIYIKSSVDIGRNPNINPDSSLYEQILAELQCLGATKTEIKVKTDNNKVHTKGTLKSGSETTIKESEDNPDEFIVDIVDNFIPDYLETPENAVIKNVENKEDGLYVKYTDGTESNLDIASDVDLGGVLTVITATIEANSTVSIPYSRYNLSQGKFSVDVLVYKGSSLEKDDSNFIVTQQLNTFTIKNNTEAEAQIKILLIKAQSNKYVNPEYIMINKMEFVDGIYIIPKQKNGSFTYGHLIYRQDGDNYYDISSMFGITENTEVINAGVPFDGILVYFSLISEASEMQANSSFIYDTTLNKSQAELNKEFAENAGYFDNIYTKSEIDALLDKLLEDIRK